MGIPPSNDTFTWEDVIAHNKHDDKWLVIEGKVYDITNWSRRHPGGSRVISHFAGQDATDAFRAFHNDLGNVKKYLTPIYKGDLRKGEYVVRDMDKDFREVRATAEKMNLFKPNFWFYFFHLGHILALEAMAYLVMHWYGTGWIPWTISLLCYSTVQAQTGWLQHDFGHLSVCKSSFWDHRFHDFVMGFIKGASRQWWNHMHYQHHAKPNVMDKDPDVRIDKLFVVGDVMPVEKAKEKKQTMPYNLQHKYFFLIGPPLLFPVYFQFMLIRHIITRRAWSDLFWMMTFFVKFIYLYYPLLGLKGVIVYYFLMRCLESHWFTWVSQANHIPMEIDHDSAKPWLKLQMHATCNIEKSFFNDWFTGHLNFQIEHHLFPTMPRHNLYKIQPLVKSVCQKHGIDYQVKTLSGAFVDIVRTLKHSGELWYASYHAYHVS
ncbi:acyl-CoA 6-desaturase-like [Liolophura sinensis]|uniref:acyl-CoA 6-desaturase-like n=1 Tax=Liolophura sinensis TaxID=3198878 RepID=UPI003158202D